MEDKELLELAAKAARMEINLERQFERNELGFGHVGLWIVNGSTRWNPLTDDGDALRLASHLNMDIEINEFFVVVYCPFELDCSRVELSFEDEKLKSIKKAITMAAAQIGKEME